MFRWRVPNIEPNIKEKRIHLVVNGENDLTLRSVVHQISMNGEGASKLKVLTSRCHYVAKNNYLNIYTCFHRAYCDLYFVQLVH